MAEKITDSVDDSADTAAEIANVLKCLNENCVVDAVNVWKNFLGKVFRGKRTEML